MNGMPHLNNGCLLLREDPSLQARIASVHYEYYDELSALDDLLAPKMDEIQCVVGNIKLRDYQVLPFGTHATLEFMPNGTAILKASTNKSAYRE